MTDRLEGADGPLRGFRVLDISTMIAAPFSAALLADFGAEVIKVELPGQGDALRNVAPMFADRSLYWSVLGRNKCSITLDLRVPRGRELFLELVKRSDVILENFRPGTLERWDLSYDTLKATNSDMVLVRVSGYGQDGPYRDKAGFGTPAAAIGGLTYIMVLSVSTDRIWLRMTEAIGHPEWAVDPRFASDPQRTANADQARQDIIEPDDPDIGPIPMPAVLPRFSRTPGRVRFVGPRLGAHNAEILGGLLGLTDEEQSRLQQQGTI